MADQPDSRLFHIAKETYGDSFRTDLLEQYKLYVQSAENVSARRVASSNYLLTLNTAIVALYGFQSASFGQNCWALLVPFAGILVSWLWCRIIKSHADLNSVKFALIHEMEQHLPAEMYKYEWQLAGGGARQGLQSGDNPRTIDTCSVCYNTHRFGDHNYP